MSEPPAGAKRTGALAAPRDDAQPPAAGDTIRLLHELQVHQIELEAQQSELRTQNEQLRAAREETHTALRRYRELYDFAPAALFTLTRDGTIVQANLAGAELLGTTRSEIVGRRLGGFVAAAERGAFAGMLDRTFADRRRQGVELTLVGFGGEDHKRIVRIEGQRDALDAVACRVVAVDMTERRLAQQQLQVAASVWESMDDAVMVADEAQRIVAVNPAFVRLTGYSAQEATGRTTRVLDSDRHDDAFYAGLWRGEDRADAWSGEVWYRRKNGSEFMAELKIHTLRSPGGAVTRRIAVFRDITEQRQIEEAIWRQANYDSLTGLPNRQLFMDRLRQSVDKAARSQRPMALLFVDLDRFKDINDGLGHEVGDRMLTEVARRITACVRGTDTTARLGGDEFAVVMTEVDNLHRATQVADCIVESIRRPFHSAGRELHTGASIGVTTCPGDGIDAGDLLRCADQAMYCAKAAGGSQVSHYTSQMQSATGARLELVEELRRASAAGQFEVYYQPIVSLADGRLRKLEALLRWQHPVRGLVEPEHFIPIAEEFGLLDEIGDWVFKEATRRVARWQAGGERPAPASLQVSINASPRQLYAHGRAGNWVAWLRDLGLPAGSVIIEITEGVLLEDRPEVRRALQCFDENGIEIALDDFGQGFSALSYLTRFPIDYLKIDRAFINGLSTDASSRAIVEAIVVMAHKLGIRVVAEGVETEDQRARLKAIGCDFAQGNLFGAPMPGDEVHLA